MIPAQLPAMPPALRRPWPVALLLGAVAQALFLWRLTIPSKPFFDEVHYLPAARTLWALDGPTNIEHPLVAKALIGLGIHLFGDGPLGWRILSTVAGTATVTGVFALVWLGLGRVRAATWAAGLTLLNFTVFIQARIAMLDGFMGAFVVTGAVCLLWAMRGAGRVAWARWTAGAVLMGLAVATKWIAAPYVALAGLAFLLLGRRRPDRWAGMGRIAAVLVLGGVSVAVYFATFVPAFFYAHDPLTLSGLIPFQWEMLARQTQVLPAHTYQSSWWSWPLVIRPIWYLYEPVDGAVRGVLMIGNPGVMWGGLVAVAACGWAWVRHRDVAAGSAAALWIAGWGMWALVPKSLGFFYYYYLPSLWLPVALAVAIDRWRRTLRGWDEAYLAAAVVLFVHFHPILSAAALDRPQAFQKWMWFSTWP